MIEKWLEKPSATAGQITPE